MQCNGQYRHDRVMAASRAGHSSSRLLMQYHLTDMITCTQLGPGIAHSTGPAQGDWRVDTFSKQQIVMTIRAMPMS